MGGPSGLVIPPYRVIRKTAREHWDLKPSDSDDFVFCHNNLSMQNVIVYPISLKIRAIIDWEYIGLYPEYFDTIFYKRLGLSVALEGEKDDSEELLDFLYSYQVLSFTKYSANLLRTFLKYRNNQLLIEMIQYILLYLCKYSSMPRGGHKLDKLYTY